MSARRKGMTERPELVAEAEADDKLTARQLEHLAELAAAPPAGPGVPTNRLSSEELCRLGQEIYDRDLKSRLEPAHNGEYVVIHVVNGDYFVDDDDMQAVQEAMEKYPGNRFFSRRIGRLDRL
jgi:hypothetical protein